MFFDEGNNAAEYVEFINDNFIDTLPKDKVHKILVLGAGGFAVGLNDEINQYTFVDIEKNLKEVTEKYFLHKPLSKNKKLEVMDAYLFMINTKEKYDLIVIDIYKEAHGIPENFVTADFFAMVKEHLNERGIMVANIVASASFNEDFSRRIDNTLRYVFKNYLSRQVIKKFDAYGDELSNVIYSYYNYTPDTTIYTMNKNSALYGQKLSW